MFIVLIPLFIHVVVFRCDQRVLRKAQLNLIIGYECITSSYVIDLMGVDAREEKVKWMKDHIGGDESDQRITIDNGIW
ncbi:hypothetical protein [Vibrio sinaloensis]|uniref:hypothetical protein n=1 Tax=Photobacterium sp. (strain ATCC 43367) TaxID=379097 RepID=UPI00206408CD|nr:hypothetical protein [Vibrio sinaloensis]UPQ89887.1 hypothetical protein MTO69_14045 [Vibrio sinaloensis]